MAQKAATDWVSGFERRVSSAAVALYDQQGRVLLVKASYKPYWTFPGGVIDSSETPRMAAVRETWEETGIELLQDDLEFCIVADRVSDIAHTYQLVFEQQVDPRLFENITIDGGEITDWILVSRSEIMSGDRYYSQTAQSWAEGATGYLEQQFSN